MDPWVLTIPFSVYKITPMLLSTFEFEWYFSPVFVNFFFPILLLLLVLLVVFLEFYMFGAMPIVLVKNSMSFELLKNDI